MDNDNSAIVEPADVPPEATTEPNASGDRLSLAEIAELRNDLASLAARLEAMERTLSSAPDAASVQAKLQPLLEAMDELAADVEPVSDHPLYRRLGAAD